MHGSLDDCDDVRKCFASLLLCWSLYQQNLGKRKEFFEKVQLLLFVTFLGKNGVQSLLCWLVALLVSCLLAWCGLKESQTKYDKKWSAKLALLVVIGLKLASYTNLSPGQGKPCTPNSTQFLTEP